MRDRLIELLKMIEYQYTEMHSIMTQNVADFLLQRGVIVPPCKCGDTVYYFSHRPLNISVEANTIYEATVVRIVTTRLGTQLVIQIRNEWGCTEVPDIRSWGKTVFLTREEAEKALRGGDDE